MGLTLEQKKALSNRKPEVVTDGRTYTLEEKRAMQNRRVEDKAFNIQQFVGRQILRGNLNVRRIHILNAFINEYAESPYLAEQQAMIDSGLLIPAVVGDSPAEMLSKFAFLMQYMDSMQNIPGSDFKILVFLNTPNAEVLDKVVLIARDFGIIIRYEHALSDEVPSSENLKHWEMARKAMMRRAERESKG